MISSGKLQKVIGEVKVTLYEGGLAALKAEQGGIEVDLHANHRFVLQMLQAGKDALSRSRQVQKRVWVPTR